MTLYEIDNAINNVLENGVQVDEETGEVLFMADDLERLELDRKDKIEAIALFVKNKEALAEDIAEEIKTLTERKKAAERSAERWKEYLAYVLDGERFETGKCAITYRKTSKVEVDDVEALPDDYVRLEIKKSADKTAIKNALGEGKEISGCRIVVNQKMHIK